jgi:hypothetical protein
MAPHYYLEMCAAMEHRGIKGRVEMKKSGEIFMELEGPHAAIAPLVRDLNKGRLLGTPFPVEMMWRPFLGKFQRLVLYPFATLNQETPPKPEKSV